MKKNLLLTAFILLLGTKNIIHTAVKTTPANTDTHLPQCITLHQTAEAKESLFKDPTICNERIARYIEALFEKYQIIVAIKDSIVVGMIAFIKLTPVNAYIETLFVRNNCRTQGIGTQLLNHVLNSSLKNSTVRLNTNKVENTGAYALYKKHGFKEKQCFGNLCVLEKPAN